MKKRNRKREQQCPTCGGTGREVIAAEFWGCAGRSKYKSGVTSIVCSTCKGTGRVREWEKGKEE